MQNDILTIEYQQTLHYNSEQRGWSERLDISVRLHAEALTTGWLRDQFVGRSGPLEFMVLMAITLHTQPLKGKALQQLVQLGAAHAEDEGRMYSMVTDLGLGAELGIDRHTVDAVTRRLADKRLIDIWDLPPQLRDQGRFANSKIYVLSGTVQQAFVKEITPRSIPADEHDTHRGSRPTTVEPEAAHRGSRPATVKAAGILHRGGSGPDRAADPATNVVVVDVVDQERGISDSFSDDEVFAHFAVRKGQTYSPTGRDRQALSSLRTSGYSFAEITGGIDQAFDRGDQPKRFAYCARIVQDTPPAHSPAAPVRLPDVADSMLQPDHIDNAPTPIDIPVDLAKAVEMYRGSGQELRPDVIARLRLLAKECDAAARQHDSTGAEWLTQALQRSLGVADDLLLYAQGVLRNWIAHGPNLDARPGRAGYRPARYADPPTETPPQTRPARNWDAE